MSGLGQIKALLLDLSGTLHVEDEAVAGAAEGVAAARRAGLPLAMVTNTTKVGEE
jgi:ribonucleotide monophosphatase NagD (HAD superfamily)